MVSSRPTTPLDLDLDPWTFDLLEPFELVERWLLPDLDLDTGLGPDASTRLSSGSSCGLACDSSSLSLLTFVAWEDAWVSKE